MAAAWLPVGVCRPAVGAALAAARRALRDAMDRYQKVRVVGKGAFGAALLVNDRRGSGKQYVIKQVDVSRMKPREHEEAKKEIKLLAAFNHPNIVRYRDSFIEGGALHIVMDFCEGGELHALLKERRGAVLSEQQARLARPPTPWAADPMPEPA